jgi:hypothetical protein
MRATAMALVGWLMGGCGGGSESGPTITGTVASLSPGGGPPAVVSLQWLDEQGLANTHEAGGSAKIPETLPAMFSITTTAPTRFAIDFDGMRALPTCPSPSPGQCWPANMARWQGRGKLAVGAFLAYTDEDGNGQYTTPIEMARGYDAFYVLYAKDLDGQAIQELGTGLVMNAQALKPGFNFARIRCKDKVGWTGPADPFEVVNQEPVVIESLEVQVPRLDSGEQCYDWGWL